ncbi:SMP-30/gluconolactonase/LRE family protein [bacterium]|nr:SMP-30/gluconolactonase/LRE family protein [bacterium]
MKKMELYGIGIIFLSSFYPAIGQIDSNYRENRNKAFVAKTVAECQSSLKFCKEALKVAPNHPLINYLAARLNALLGNEDIAIKYLKKATELGYTTKLPPDRIHHLNDTAFSKLRKEKKFEEIIIALKKVEKPIHNSQIAFTISDKELWPEGITYDPVEKMFYFGSVTKHKIVKVDHFGKSIDFTEEGQDGLNIVVGIHVDPVRRTLWACSVSETKKEIFKYNLSSGKLIKKYSFPPDEKKRYSFNDLVIHPNGDIYISGGGAIYVIPHDSDKLEWFLRDNLIVLPNGITLSDDGRTIYSADQAIGIYKIDIKTKSFSLLSHSSEFSSIIIDGLYFRNNNLYAVQPILNTISRFTLNKDATYIESREIYERNTAYLVFPTTGVIVGDYFYFIADPEGKSDKPGGIIIMKALIKSID